MTKIAGGDENLGRQKIKADENLGRHCLTDKVFQHFHENVQMSGAFKENYSNRKILLPAFKRDILHVHVFWIVAKAYLEPSQASK